jgi:hypothetical protein
VTDRTIGGLDALVQFGIALGIPDFRFKNLTEYHELQHGEHVRHPSSMPVDEMRQGRDSLLRCRETIVRSGGSCEIEAGILDAMEARINQTPDVVTRTLPSSAVAFAGVTPAGQTRDCLDPWEYAYVHATRTVRPCCSIDRSYGTLADGATLDSVLRNDAFRRLRQELLSGELNESCRACPVRATVPVERLRDKVAKLLSGA